MYKLIFVDNKGRTTCAYETQNIYNIDCLTGEFANKEELLKAMSYKYKKSFVKVYIKTDFKDGEKTITDIVYSNNYIPEREYMINKYAAFLIEDTSRIRYSFLRNMSRYQGNNIYYVGFFEILESLTKYMKTYRKQRDCYFHMVNTGFIELEHEPHIKREDLGNLIKNVEIDDSDDEEIMIRKVKEGLENPEMLDIDNLSVKKARRR